MKTVKGVVAFGSMLVASFGFAADFCISDFGAKTDAAASVNRAAIQRAVDAASAKGGRVVVPSGTWNTGSIELKSGVELHLEKGAKLRGSTDKRDYNADDVFPENIYSVAEEWSGGHLVYAYRAKNISITGEGVIDGNGPAFFGECEDDGQSPWYKYGLKLHPLDRDWFRPGVMVALFQCKDVRIEDVTLANTTAWTCHVRCTDGFTARGVKIFADRTIANSDGFSIDCTRNVLIEKCDVRTGDDSIALRAACKHHCASNVCENIVVRDCDLRGCCYAVRFGIGNGTLRNAKVENCRIHEAAMGFGFTASWTGVGGVKVEDVSVRDCSVKECDRPVEGEGARKVVFENCAFEGLRPVSVGGDVLFRNCSYKRIRKLAVRDRGDWSSRAPARSFGDLRNGARMEKCTPSGPRPGVLVLAFDDRNFTDWERAMPLFAKYGAHASFFVSGEITGPEIRTLKHLVESGHTVGLHGQHHGNAVFTDSKGGDAYYEKEIRLPRRQLQAALLGTDSFAYPNNRHSEETDAFLLKSFSHLRAGVPGAAPYDPKGEKQKGLKPLHENDALFFPVDELSKHRVISGAIIGEAYHTKIDEVLKCLERAAKNREVVEFTSHGIRPNAKDINMKTEWIEAILAKAKEVGLEVLSFEELD